MAATPYIFREATPAALEAAINAVIAPILTQRFSGIEVDAARNQPAFTRNLYVAATFTTSNAHTITHAYVFKTFSASSDMDARQLALNFMSTNATYFFSPIFVVYRPTVDNPNESTIVALIYNTDLTDGGTNWGYDGSGGGGPPTGAAGGDLSGTYPNPTVGPTTTGEVASGALPASSTVIGTQATATAGDVDWDVELIKGTTRYSTTVRANIADGVTPVWQEDDVTIAPPVGGTFDAPLTVVITGANITLVCTPATTGWSARVRARTLTP